MIQPCSPAPNSDIGGDPRRQKEDMGRVGSKGAIRGRGTRVVHMEVSTMGAPQTGWFIMKGTIDMDDFGVPLFQETSIFSA